MGFIQRFMYGRYGVDQLSFALLILNLVLSILSRLFHSNSILSLLGFAVAVVLIYRTFSRNLDKRRAENERFMEFIRPVVRWVNVQRCRRSDKEHCYFKCPNCGQQLRVPKGKGKLSVTCRSCGMSFEKKT